VYRIGRQEERLQRDGPQERRRTRFTCHHVADAILAIDPYSGFCEIQLDPSSVSELEREAMRRRQT